MRPHVRTVAVVLLWVASVLLAAGFGFGVGRWSFVQSEVQPLSGRTYYESLDLSSPEAAVQEFCAAFRRSDYATVYLVLAPRVHLLIANDLGMLRYGDLVQKEFADEISQELCIVRHGIGSCDYIDLATYMFDDMMLGAEKHSAFLIDLRGRETITGRRTATTYDGGPAIDVTTTVEGIEGEVVFRTLQIPVSGKWRVLQVIVPGGNEELIPWSVPTAE
jgi:hypothetical protein